ncbi:cysteine--tRNA ligase [Chromobacterium sp. IIBBL 290-4]|uniref:cysteine--tRNA ligase n=1 Tax=Chromobacterium sp. IIBBL 290-4 TaxID=2953890 RepID=UPI0020B84E07|nr:cysteine--tRNA ligase [Chromobacterium sp. IIBBL 290-4]UTH76649.1 cysteine--tRNA ligase [Chromobacterium sp. IIBBL 290-4]
MQLQLYDTWHRAVRPFAPLNDDHVGLYCCGPTVYDYAHIGNLRTYLFEDTLRRALELNGYRVRHVVNITDVGHLVSDGDDGEDKMEAGSRRAGGESAWDIAERFTAAFQQDLAALNALPPTIWSRATDHIAEQIEYVAALERKGYVYRTSDGMYFDTARLDDYGHLARLDAAGLQAGNRVEMGEKRNPTDFSLWKFSPAEQKRQMEWDSPWGRGFPGWHIECSAMSAKHLGPWFDIHCGGEDHIPVHHSNEIAQSQGCHGTRAANFWMHGYFLQLDDAKMSKSSGDFLRLQTLIDRGYDPLAYRYLNLTAHYRKQMSFSWTALDGAAQALDKLRQRYAAWPEGGAVLADVAAAFRAEINQDLNTPKALALVWGLVKDETAADADKKATLRDCDRLLGLDLDSWQPREEETPAQVRELLARREAARAARDWAESDALRGEILALGYVVEDGRDGAAAKLAR